MKEFFPPEEEKNPEEESWKQIIEKIVLTAKEKLEISFSKEETSAIIQKVEEVMTKIRYGIVPLDELETPRNLQPKIGDVFIFFNFCEGKYSRFSPDVKIFLSKVVAETPGIRLRNFLLGERIRKEITLNSPGNGEIIDFFPNPCRHSLISLKNEKLSQN